MAKFAPVAPIQILEGLLEHGTSTFGDYHLMLAHHCVEESVRFGQLTERYHKDQVRYSPYNCTVIMDNSVVELGKAVDDAMVAEACRILSVCSYGCRFKVIPVLPDVMGKGVDTWDQSEEAYHRWAAGVMPYDSYMVIIQGENWREWCDCANQFFVHHAGQFPKITHVGIPRILTDTIGSRIQAIQYIRMIAPHVKIHLFGFSENVVDDLLCARILQGSEGIDSAVPLRHMNNGDPEDPTLYCPTAHTPPRKDSNWWEEGEVTNLLLQNLANVRKWVA